METNAYLVSCLRQVPFMRYLPAAYRQELARICSQQHCDAGEVIIRQGSITDRFYVVAEGHVRFRRIDQQRMWRPAGDARPGQHFGLAMFTTQALSEYEAEALTETEVFAMERRAFDGLVEKRPDILNAMRPIYLKRLELTRGFDWLTPGEEVVLTTHRHWFALVESLVAPVAVGLIVGAVMGAAIYFGLPAFLDLPPLLAAVPAALIVGWLGYAINDYIDDDFIITNKRVAHVERVFLKKELRYQIPNDKIQSMQVRYVGLLASALKLGNLEVQSAGRADSRIVFDRVARAEKIRDKISEQRGNLKAHEEAEMRRQFHDRVEKDLTPVIDKKPGKDDLQEAPKPRPRRSWSAFLVSTWRRMFGREFRDGSTITYRKHWVALVRQAGRWMVVFIVLMIALIIYLAVPLLQILPRAPALAAYAFLLLVDLGGLAWQWEDWRNDIYQVTDNQIIDIERRPLGLSSRSTEAPVSNVQNARALRPGAINAILNYGNVEVQTAGGGPPLVFYDVSSPEEIVEEVFRRLEAHRQRQMQHQMIVQAQQVTDALITYHQMGEKRAALQAGTGVVTEKEPSAQSSLPLGAGTASALGDGKERESAAEPPASTGPRGQVLQEFSSIEEGEELG